MAPQGGASAALLKNDNTTLYGWSPNGKWIAFPDSKGRPAVVNAATGKVRTLLKPRPPSAVERRLVAGFLATAAGGLEAAGPFVECPSGLWRVPVDGATPHLVHAC